VKRFSFRAALATALIVATTSLPTKVWGAGGTGAVSADVTALHELLEGTAGRRETWKSAPELVILTSVMTYTADGLQTGYAATDETMTPTEVADLLSDLTSALNEWTAGHLAAFSAVRTLELAPGATTTILKRGQVTVGRFRGVQAVAGTLGYGGRSTSQGNITAGAVILDRDFDRGSDRRRLLRIHELAHALGYNHVQARPSVMNPRVGSGLTDFDRSAIQIAFAPPSEAPITQSASSLAGLAPN